MTDWQMIDPTGSLIVEMRTYAADVAVAEPATPRGQAALALGDGVYGDMKDEDRAAPYVILRRLGPGRRLPRAPFARFRYSALCVGVDPTQATRIAGIVSDSISAKGPRRRSAGVAIYLSTEEVGAQASLDPDTSEPVETVIFLVSAPLAQA